MKTLDKLLHKARYELENAKQARASAVVSMNVADARIEAHSTWVDALLLAIESEKKAEKP